MKAAGAVAGAVAAAAMVLLVGPASPAPAEADASGRATLTASDAVLPPASTVAPDLKDWTWQCGQAMTLRPAAGTGVSAAEIRERLAYPVAMLRGLGYAVTIGEPIPYVHDTEPTGRPGEVVIAATTVPAEQAGLADAAATTVSDMADDVTIRSAAVIVDAHPYEGGATSLSGDILLHELGHVVGLDHKAGTVMDVTWDSPITFDAAEVAAVDCRR